MPSQLANAVPIRASGYKIRCYASFVTGGTPVATGDVTFAPDDTAVVKHDVQIDFDTGAWTDLAYGMEVVFTDAVGNFKGRTHIRYGGSITTGSIPVREYANATLLIEAGDRYAIYDEWRLHDKLVAANSLFPPDNLPYTDQGSNPPPVACSGGHYAGKLDAGQTYATVLMTGSTSYTVDPDSGGSVTHFWTLPTGVTFAPGSANTDANPTLRATLGEYLIDHRVTDASNSKTTTQHVVVKVHDPANMPHQILWTPDTATADSGFGGTVEILRGATTQAAIPDGGLCIIWGAETVNGQVVSYRNASPGRSHILCVGIVRRDLQEGEPDGSRRVTFELVSPLQRLKELTSYSKVMEADATPDAWSQVKTLGVKRAIIQLIQFYTTLIEAGFDFTFDSAFIDYLYPAFYLQRATFYGQMEELAHGVDARATCDRTGRFSIHTDPRYIPEASRAAVTKTWTFAPRDVLGFSFSREQADSVEMMKVSGISGGASGNAPFFSVTPGASPGEAAGTPSRDRLILNPADPQTDINARAGRFFAKEDAVYQNADGLKWRAFPLTLTLRGVYDFFDFSKEYVNFSENIRNLARDVDLTDFLFCLQSTSVGYDYERGTGTTTAVFDVVTNAAPGESYFPPDESLTYPPYEYPSPQPTAVPSLTNTGILGRGTANLALFDTGANGYWLLRLADGAVAFVSLTATGTPMLGNLIMFIQDAFNTANGVIVTTTHAYRILNFDDETVVDLDDQYAFRYTTNYRSLQSERGDNGFFVCASHQDDGAVDIDRTLNSGATWTLSEQDLGANWVGGAGDGVAPGCYVYAGASGKVVVSAFSTSSTGILKQSTDEGNTFSNVGTSTFIILTNDITAPLQNESILYHGAPFNGGGYTGYRLGRTVGGVFTDVSPIYGAEPYGPVQQFGVKVCDSDQRKILLVGQNRDQGTIKRGVFLSLDACANWRVLVTPDTTVQITGGTITADGTIFLWGNALLWVSYDGGNTFLDKSAGLVAGGAGRICNIAGVAE